MRRRADLLAAVAVAAVGQGGVVSRDQLVTGGINLRMISRLKSDGLLLQVARGAYAVGRLQLPIRARLRSALLSVGPGSAIGGLSAAGLLDLRSHPSGPIHVVTTARPRRQPGIVLHHTAHLPARDLVMTDGVRSTATARTLLDVAAEVPTENLMSMLDRSVGLNLFDYTAFSRVVEERPTIGGCAPLRKAVALLDETSGRNRSELERRLIALINQSPLPKAQNNVMLHGMEVDTHWIGTRAVIEADGREFHLTPQQRADDIAKQEALAALGFVVRRFDWAAVNYRPEETLRYAGAFLEANQMPPVPRLRR